jgi:Tol biopolymer transport system component
MKSFDRFVVFFLLGLLGLILVLLVLGDRVGVQITSVNPQPDKPISSYGKIAVLFNQPMNAQSVEQGFSISPHVEGQITWEGNQLSFTPATLLHPDIEYHVSIKAGTESENGRRLLSDYSWTVSVRQPDIVYLVINEVAGDLWLYSTDTGLTFPLTNTGGQIFDFAVEPVAGRILYAQYNSQGGSEFWIIDRDGNNPTIILDCENDLCSQPAWSADSLWIAYTREEFSVAEAIALLPRVWTLYIQTGETNPLYDNPDAYSHSPSFSPNGKYLATYNINQNAIRVLNLETSQEAGIPTVLLGVGDWSPDGNLLIFSDLVPSTLEPNVGVYIADLSTQSVDHAFGEFIPDTDFSPPRWSPDGEWIAFAARPVGSAVSKGIWVINLAEGDPIPITDDPTATFTAYRWDPWGERLAFQRYPITGPISCTSIWVWERSTGETRLLVENGVRPAWLP